MIVSRIQTIVYGALAHNFATDFRITFHPTLLDNVQFGTQAGIPVLSTFCALMRLFDKGYVDVRKGKTMLCLFYLKFFPS